MSIFTIPVASSFTTTEGYTGTHLSLDFAVPVGTTVVAAAPGVVLSEGDDGALGDTIKIQHAGGYETLYGNLSSYSVAIGDQVSAGQKIGTSGGAKGSKDAGDSTGPHLPFQVWKNGKPVNPSPLVGVNPGSSGASIETASDTSSLLNPFAGLNQAGQSFGIIGSWLGNSGNWVRVGLGALGLLFLIIALVKLFDTTSAGKAVNSAIGSTVKTGVSAAKVAALA